MDILLITGKFSTLSILFIKEFGKKLPEDKLIVFVLTPFKRGNSFMYILKKNRLSYLAKKGVQFVNMHLRSALSMIFTIEPRYISEVLEYYEIEHYFINDVNNQDVVNLIREKQTDLLITYDCGQILKKDAIRVSSIASLNVHSSLLPKYRGTAPIYWVIKNKEKETGVTIHFIDEGIDTGDIILQNKIAINPGMREKTLTKALAQLGAESIFAAIQLFKDNSIERIKQDLACATYYSNTERVY